MPIWLQVLSILMPFLSALTLFYLKLNSDRKKDAELAKKEAEAREIERERKEEERTKRQNDYIRTQIGDLSDKLVSMESLLKEHIKDSDFRLNFKNRISNVTMTLIKASDLELEYKSIISFWFSEIEDFVMDFYYSSYRSGNNNHNHNHKELGDDLEQKFEILLSEFNNHVDLVLKEVRIYNSKKIRFFKFLEDTHFFNKSRVLVNRLPDNGFKGEEGQDVFITLIINYMNTFYSDFLTSLRVWRKCRMAYEEEEAA